MKKQETESQPMFSWLPVIEDELPIGISLMKKMLNVKHNIGLASVKNMILLLKYQSLKQTNQERLDNYV